MLLLVVGGLDVHELDGLVGDEGGVRLIGVGAGLLAERPASEDESCGGAGVGQNLLDDGAEVPLHLDDDLDGGLFGHVDSFQRGGWCHYSGCKSCEQIILASYPNHKEKDTLPRLLERRVEVLLQHGSDSE